MTPKYSTEVLPTVPKHKKAGRRPVEKIHVLDQLHSDVSAIGYEFNSHESTTYMK